MYKNILLAGLFLFLSCASEKKGLDLENETDLTLLEKARAAYEQADYKQAIMLNQAMIDNFPMSDLHIDAQLSIARSLGAMEKFEEQLDLLLRILKENIVPERVPEIYVQIAQIYENAARWNPGIVTDDTSDLKLAARYYRKAVFYPNSNDNEAKALALYRAGLMYAKLHQYDTASRAYEQVKAFYPESIYSRMADIKLRDPRNTDEIDAGSLLAAGTETQPGEVTETPQEQNILTTEGTQEGKEIQEMIGESPVDSLEQQMLQDTSQYIPELEQEVAEPDSGSMEF